MSDYGTPPPPPPGPESGYGQMPQMSQGGTAQAAAVRPPAMDQAILLMKVGAGISLLGLLITLFSRGTIRDAVEKASQNAATPMSPSQIDAAVTAGIVTGIVAGLIGVALWLWMASANGKGKSWARVVATVFFAISVLSFLVSLIQAQPLLTRVLGIVQVVLGAYIIFLIYKKESSEFYRAASAPRA